MDDKTIDKIEAKWYVIRVPSGKENAMIDKLKSASRLLLKDEIDPNDYFIEFSVPQKLSFEYKNGKKVEKLFPAYPGYLFVKLKMTNKICLFIKNTLKMSKIVGDTNPIALSNKEYDDMMSKITDVNSTRSVSFTIGQKLKILSGSFASMVGTVDHIDETAMKLTVTIPIFGYDTKVDVDFDQVASPESSD
jgi:transcriptional antiterminator NusG